MSAVVRCSAIHDFWDFPENEQVYNQDVKIAWKWVCRDDLELRWRLLMCENEFSHIISISLIMVMTSSQYRTCANFAHHIVGGSY